MSIKADIHTDVHGNIIIQMQGGLNYENGIPLRQELQNMVKENPHSTIIIDFLKVDFVGSSGIGTFVETLNMINKEATKIKLANVKSEFLKVFKLYNLTSKDKSSPQHISTKTIEEFAHDEPTPSPSGRTFEN